MKILLLIIVYLTVVLHTSNYANAQEDVFPKMSSKAIEGIFRQVHETLLSYSKAKINNYPCYFKLDNKANVKNPLKISHVYNMFENKEFLIKIETEHENGFDSSLVVCPNGLPDTPKLYVNKVHEPENEKNYDHLLTQDHGNLVYERKRNSETKSFVERKITVLSGELMFKQLLEGCRDPKIKLITEDDVPYIIWVCNNKKTELVRCDMCVIDDVLMRSVHQHFDYLKSYKPDFIENNIDTINNIESMERYPFSRNPEWLNKFSRNFNQQIKDTDITYDDLISKAKNTINGQRIADTPLLNYLAHFISRKLKGNIIDISVSPETKIRSLDGYEFHSIYFEEHAFEIIFWKPRLYYDSPSTLMLQGTFLSDDSNEMDSVLLNMNSYVVGEFDTSYNRFIHVMALLFEKKYSPQDPPQDPPQENPPQDLPQENPPQDLGVDA